MVRVELELVENLKETLLTLFKVVWELERKPDL